MALLPFGVLAHIDQDGFWIGRQPLARFVDGDFLHLRARLVHDFQKSRRMFHMVTIEAGAKASMRFAAGWSRPAKRNIFAEMRRAFSHAVIDEINAADDRRIAADLRRSPRLLRAARRIAPL